MNSSNTIPSVATTALRFRPKDYIETQEGLFFAVVSGEVEAGYVLGYLRYQRQQQQLVKLSSAEAKNLLEKFPQYQFFSEDRDAMMQGVPLIVIANHYCPRIRVNQILADSESADPIILTCAALIKKLQHAGLDISQLGVTGSLLIGAQNPSSDIDLLVYEREAFQQARDSIRLLLEEGMLHPLSEADWEESYERRGCSLDFHSYVWHERRKLNKAIIDGIKFDISLYDEQQPLNLLRVHRKLNAIELTAEVVNDQFAYDFPAMYLLDHPVIKRVLSFTATYSGQVMAGEKILVAGTLEETEDGLQQIVVGSDREAQGEFIRVIG